jgi:CRISPR-associated protein Cas1
LADDLMEPFRPTVDRSVVEYVNSHDSFNRIESSAKKAIISDLTSRYMVGGEQRTLFDTVGRVAASLADVFMGNAERIELPDW